MTIKLYPDERLDDLQRSGYHIIQNPKKFCFGMDAVLLSGFAKAKPGDIMSISFDVNKIHVFDKETQMTITN